jgi:hypothetical protein
VSWRGREDCFIPFAEAEVVHKGLTSELIATTRGDHFMVSAPPAPTCSCSCSSFSSSRFSSCSSASASASSATNRAARGCALAREGERLDLP